MTAMFDLNPGNRQWAATEASRARLITAGVNGRLLAQGLAMASDLVPDTTPTCSHEESAAIVAINAVAVTEPEELT
jgi:hypothetical protein